MDTYSYTYIGSLYLVSNQWHTLKQDNSILLSFHNREHILLRQPVQALARSTAPYVARSILYRPEGEKSQNDNVNLFLRGPQDQTGWGHEGGEEGWKWARFCLGTPVRWGCQLCRRVSPLHKHFKKRGRSLARRKKTAGRIAAGYSSSSIRNWFRAMFLCPLKATQI